MVNLDRDMKQTAGSVAGTRKKKWPSEAEKPGRSLIYYLSKGNLGQHLEKEFIWGDKFKKIFLFKVMPLICFSTHQWWRTGTWVQPVKLSLAHPTCSTSDSTPCWCAWDDKRRSKDLGLSRPQGDSDKLPNLCLWINWVMSCWMKHLSVSVASFFLIATLPFE